MEGWIKLHRKFLEWEWYSDINTKSLFIHLLLIANREDKTWRGVTIKRGQLVTGLKSLNEGTGLSIQSIRTSLDRLIRTGEINKQSNNLFTVITICNFETYQSVDENTNKQNNIRLTSNQQATNNKQEYKKEKNIIEEYILLVQSLKNLFDLKYFDEKKWHDCIRLLIENDGYKSDEIVKIATWARADNFWSPNFMSLLKLRNKNKDGVKYIDVFKSRMDSEAKKRNGVNGTKGVNDFFKDTDTRFVPDFSNPEVANQKF